MYSKIVRKLNRPGNFFRYSSPDSRMIYNKIRRLLDYNSIKNRVTLSNKLISKITPLSFDRDIGYSILDPFPFPLVEKAVKYSKEIFSEQTEDDLANVSNAKVVLPIAKETDQVNLQNPLIKLALDPIVISTVSNYLGLIPILSNVQLWYSPNDSVSLGSSQEFHLDHADVNQVKIFVAVEDIDEDSGPLLGINSISSTKLCRKIGYRLSQDQKRVDDKVIEDIIGLDSITAFIGRKGTLSFVDTCSCLHAGSRKSKKPRTIIMLQYLSPFAFHYPVFGLKNSVPFRNVKSKSLINTMVLGKQN